MRGGGTVWGWTRALCIVALGTTAANAQNFSSARLNLAISGAHCLLDAQELDFLGEDFNRTLIAERSGTPEDQIRNWGEQRALLHDLAMSVLRASGGNPPEPFESILRQTQTDCADAERSWETLQREITLVDIPLAEALSMPLEVPDELTASVLNDVQERDLRIALYYASQAIEAGFGTQAQKRLDLIAERPVDMIHTIQITTWDEASALARDILQR